MRVLKKKNFLINALLKLTNKKRYARYKKLLEIKKHRDSLNQEITRNRARFPSMKRPVFFNQDKFRILAETQGVISFKHSGNSGDILYALPTLKKIKELTGAQIALTLNLNVPVTLPKGWKHPYGTVMLTDESPQLFKNLLVTQGYIDKLDWIQNGEPFLGDVDLDWFRIVPINKGAGHLARWYIPLTTIHPDLMSPWLSVQPMSGLDDMILLARSARYHQRSIRHQFLAQYPRVGFVGVDSEYEVMRQQLPRLERVPVTDFLEMAQAIAGAHLFIGNQTFAFSLAEALKAPRLLEVCQECPNVIPLGAGGYDFYSQEQFEFLVKNAT